MRKSLRIRNGENLEIFVNENENIVLRKYNQLDKLEEISNELIKSFYKITKKNIYITSNEKIIGSNQKEYINKEISDEINEIIENRKETTTKNLLLTKTQELKEKSLIWPILVNGDTIGSIILENNDITDIDKKLINLSANFLSIHIEA